MLTMTEIIFIASGGFIGGFAFAILTIVAVVRKERGTTGLYATDQVHKITEEDMTRLQLFRI